MKAQCPTETLQRTTCTGPHTCRRLRLRDPRAASRNSATAELRQCSWRQCEPRVSRVKVFCRAGPIGWLTAKRHAGGIVALANCQRCGPGYVCTDGVVSPLALSTAATPSYNVRLAQSRAFTSPSTRLNTVTFPFRTRMPVIAVFRARKAITRRRRYPRCRALTRRGA